MVMTDDIRIPVLDAMEEAGAPDHSAVSALLKQNQTYFQTFHSLCSKVDTYYFGDNDIDTAEGFEPIHTAMAKSIIEVAADHVDVNHAAIDVPLASPRAKARAEKLKKFYQGVWLNIRNPVKRSAAKHAFAYGVAWMKTQWDADRWPNAPKMDDFPTTEAYKEALDDFMEKRNILFPFIVENINPQRMVWDTSRIGPRWAIEFYKQHPADIMQLYPQWGRQQDGDGLINWVEYWDEKYYTFIAGNEVVESGEHGYGFFPYEVVQPAMSIDWNDRPPDERYRGLLHAIFDLLDEHSRLTTAYSAIIRNTAWRTLDFSGPEHLLDKTREDYEIFGGKNKLPTGVTVQASPMINVPPDLIAELGIIETQIEAATFPNVVRGVRPRGVSSGFGVSVLAGMGRLVFQGVADGMSRAMEGCNSKFAMMVENKASGRVTVHGRSDVHQFDQSVGADDIRGYYENIVTLKAEAPEERERESMLAIRLYQGLPGFSLMEALKRSGVTNPLEMLTDRLSEDLLLSPAVRAQAEAAVGERVNLLGQLTSLLGGGGQDGMNTGNQFMPGQSQLQEPGQPRAQAAGQAAAAQPAAFPQGAGGIDLLGSMVGSAPGAARNVPSGQTI
jgi:hypothetical protein